MGTDERSELPVLYGFAPLAMEAPVVSPLGEKREVWQGLLVGLWRDYRPDLCARPHSAALTLYLLAVEYWSLARLTAAEAATLELGSDTDTAARLQWSDEVWTEERVQEDLESVSEVEGWLSQVEKSPDEELAGLPGVQSWATASGKDVGSMTTMAVRREARKWLKSQLSEAHLGRVMALARRRAGFIAKVDQKANRLRADILMRLEQLRRAMGEFASLRVPDAPE